MSAIGITVSQADRDILQEIANALNAKDISKAKSLADSSFSFEPMTDDEAKNLLKYVVENEYGSILKNKIGTTLYNYYSNSKEMVALLSITYQNPSAIKQPLIDALSNGNRAEAWYQIQYAMNTSNAGWLANRRYQEASEFGLYDTAGYTEAESKEIMRMYTKHKDTILQYETDYPPSASIEWFIGGAKTYLITTFANGKPIDNIIVGAGLDSYDKIDKTPNDTILATDQNDLIFGEKGDDVLNAGAGNDVIYGDEGNDVHKLKTGTGKPLIFSLPLPQPLPDFERRVA
jgi:hypothetical protein